MVWEEKQKANICEVSQLSLYFPQQEVDLEK